MNKIVLLSKILGGLATGFVLYDAHKNGVVESYSRQKAVYARTLPDNFLNSRKLETSSHVNSFLKDEYFDMKVDGNTKGFFASMRGYTRGFFGSFVENISTIGFTLMALLGKKSSKLGRATSIIGGAGLMFTAIKGIVHDIMGIGKPTYFSNR